MVFFINCCGQAFSIHTGIGQWISFCNYAKYSSESERSNIVTIREAKKDFQSIKPNPKL